MLFGAKLGDNAMPPRNEVNQMYEIDKTRKHFVPQMYLRGFSRANSADQIYTFDKHYPMEGIEIRSIRNVEVSKDAYSVENDKILTERETVWAEMLRNLKQYHAGELNAYIDDQMGSARLRQSLARFVVDSALRSQGLRERMQPLMRASLLLHDRQEAAALEDSIAQEPGLEHELRLTHSLVGKMTHRDNFRKRPAVLLDPFLRGEEGERYYEWYEQGSWRFDEPPDDRTFITSDIPSTTFILGPEPQYENWMWFFMPISGKLHLTGLCGDARLETGSIPRSGELDDKQMDIINVSVYRCAQRNVYSSSVEELDRIIRLSVDVA